MLISVLTITIKNFTRIQSINYHYFNSPWTKFYSMEKNNLLDEFEIIKINEVKIFKPKKNYCMYINGICSHYGVNENLKLKKIGNYLVFYK